MSARFLCLRQTCCDQCLPFIIGKHSSLRYTNITKVEKVKNEVPDHVRIWVKVIGIDPLAYTNTDLNHTSNSTFKNSSFPFFYSVSIILLLPNEKCDAESFPI